MNSSRPGRKGSKIRMINDQHFLVNFIMGTYLGPDVRTDIPRRSASQRIAEGLPRYSKNDLGKEYITLPKIERLYYYIVRNAHPSVVLRPRSLHKYLNGNFPCPSKGTLEENNQFISFFPPNVHLRRRFENTCKIFVGIISIEEPSASHIAPQNLERFMKLTQAITLNIDKEVAGLYFHCGYDDAKQAKQAREEVKEWMETRLGLEETPPNGLLSKHPASFSQPKPEVSLKRRCAVNQQQLEVPGPSDLVHVQPPPVEKALGSTSLVPTSNEEGAWWSIRKGALHLTGTARKRRVAPAVGMFDIYVSNDAYLFRVSLPGVKSDPDQFSCKVESDGSVRILGITETGPAAIIRQERVFVMRYQLQCPPGPFEINFHLPGPVKPSLIASKFGTDGIFEAMVIKDKGI